MLMMTHQLRSCSSLLLSLTLVESQWAGARAGMAGMQACHELVPPDVMTAVLRQLVDAFVHDRARPEVMTLGLKTVRELCARMPLIMTSELLQVARHTPCTPRPPQCTTRRVHRPASESVPDCIFVAALLNGSLMQHHRCSFKGRAACQTI